MEPRRSSLTEAEELPRFGRLVCPWSTCSPSRIVWTPWRSVSRLSGHRRSGTALDAAREINGMRGLVNPSHGDCARFRSICRSFATHGGCWLPRTCWLVLARSTFPGLGRGVKRTRSVQLPVRTGVSRSCASERRAVSTGVRMWPATSNSRAFLHHVHRRRRQPLGWDLDGTGGVRSSFPRAPSWSSRTGMVPPTASSLLRISSLGAGSRSITSSPRRKIWLGGSSVRGSRFTTTRCPFRETFTDGFTVEVRQGALGTMPGASSSGETMMRDPRRSSSTRGNSSTGSNSWAVPFSPTIPVQERDARL